MKEIGYYNSTINKKMNSEKRHRRIQSFWVNNGCTTWVLGTIGVIGAIGALYFVAVTLFSI